MQTESMFNNLKQEESKILLEISNQSTLLSDLNNDLDKVRKMIQILTGGETVSKVVESPTQQTETKTSVTPRPRRKRLEKALEKKVVINNKQQAIKSKKITYHDQILNALKTLKSGTKEDITSYLTRDKTNVDLKERKKIKHNVTVIASNMLHNKELAVKDMVNRSFVYTLPKNLKKEVLSVS